MKLVIDLLLIFVKLLLLIYLFLFAYFLEIISRCFYSLDAHSVTQPPALKH